jgi:hypothetical protein
MGAYDDFKKLFNEKHHPYIGLIFILIPALFAVFVYFQPFNNLTETHQIINKNTPEISRSLILDLTTSSGIWIMMLLILPFLAFKTHSIAHIIAIMIVISCIALVYYYPLSIIPTIYNKAWINYILNSFIQVLSVLIMVKLQRAKEKKT